MFSIWIQQKKINWIEFFNQTFVHNISRIFSNNKMQEIFYIEFILGF